MTVKSKYCQAIITIAALSASSTSLAEQYTNSDWIDDKDAVHAFENGTIKFNFRLRHENAKVGTLRTSKATTLRSQIDFTTSDDNELQFGIGLTDVSSFFGRRYNPGVTSLQRPNYSLVQDPKGTGLTNLFFKYGGLQHTMITVGRQYISVGNGRFIGKRDFRQFPQSFDAITIKNQGIRDLTAEYSYIDHVNTTNASSRNSEGRRKIRTHLLNLDWSGTQYNVITGTVLLNKDRTTPANSNLILALGIKSSEEFSEVMDFRYNATIAEQQAKYNNPNHYKAHYFGANASKNFSEIDASVGYERLSGKNSSAVNQAFKMPLGDYHPFLGLADALENTPARGVQDFNIGAKASFPNSHVDVGLKYHNFRFAETAAGSSKIGHEYDIFGTLHLNKHLNVDIVLAQFYSRNSIVPKTRRMWVSMNAHF